ncbi:MAG TPA: YlxM family DNA-binding protein [Oscillospiraceae bacterium]|nr:YlxM family DNA-binding protein [Oscillospiraceae bacterium]
MSKDLNIALLLDFYGEMLTEKQRDMVELYYNEDLSLGEIAETVKITRQGVRDSIKRGEQQLFELEKKLGLVEKFMKYSELLDNIDEYAKNINKESTTYNYSRTISVNAQKIIECVRQSKEIV